MNRLSQERKREKKVGFFVSFSVSLLLFLPHTVNNNVFAGQRASRSASLQTSTGSVAAPYFWSLSITCIFQAVQLNTREKKRTSNVRDIEGIVDCAHCLIPPSSAGSVSYCSPKQSIPRLSAYSSQDPLRPWV